MYCLAESLTGFEILITSEDIAPLENTAKQLTDNKTLADYYKKIADFPMKLITKLYSNTTKNSTNDHTTANQKANHWKASMLIEWANHSPPLSFNNAKQAFQKKFLAFEKIQQDLSELEHCINELEQFINSQQIPALTQQLNDYNQQLQLLTEQCRANHDDDSRYTGYLKQYKKRLHYLTQHRPPLWTRLFRTKTAKRYQHHHQRMTNLVYDILATLNQLSEQYVVLERQEQALSRAINDCKTKILEKQSFQAALENKIKNLSLCYYANPDFHCSTNLNNINHIGLWQNKKLNQVRNELFFKALDLHAAWLYESIKQDLFTPNLTAITAIQQNPNQFDANQSQYIWQSLFMITPVVSAPLGSLQHSFKALHPQSLGWLIIDNAEQSAPVSAVGALWYTTRAVVFGKSTQTKPVSQYPIPLINKLGYYHLVDAASNWSPSTQSIHSICNRQSIYGTYSPKKHWYSMPLQMYNDYAVLETPSCV